MAHKDKGTLSRSQGGTTGVLCLHTLRWEDNIGFQCSQLISSALTWGEDLGDHCPTAPSSLLLLLLHSSLG